MGPNGRRRIPEATVARLPLYYRALIDCTDKNVATVSSDQLAEMAGVNAALLAIGGEPAPPPRATALGSLVHYITQAESKNFQPANITFDLLPSLNRKVRDRQERRRLQCEFALREFADWIGRNVPQATCADR